MKVTSIWARWTNARPGGAGRCQRVTWRPHAGRAGDTSEAVAKFPPCFRAIRAARDRATNRGTVAPKPVGLKATVDERRPRYRRAVSTRSRIMQPVAAAWEDDQVSTVLAAAAVLVVVAAILVAPS